MSEDFVSAAARHVVDSELLLSHGRADNCAYLSGYAVECSLKAVIAAAGATPKSYGHELVIMGRQGLELAILISPAIRRYRPGTVERILDLSKDWETVWRYQETGSVSRQQAESLVENARRAFEELVVPLVLDGREEVPR